MSKKDDSFFITSPESLIDSNPEIFVTNPRPGGFLKIDPFGKKKCKCKTPDESKSASSMRSGRTRSSRLDATTREIRLSRAVDETEWDLTDFDEDITIGVPNPAHDSMHMLTITLSTIMLMAADEKIPDLHLQWTEKYLECIRDEFGRHPPNVQGILNYIKMITGQQVERIESETKRNPSPSSSVSSRKTNDSKQFAVRTTTTVKPKRNSTSSEPGDTS